MRRGTVYIATESFVTGGDDPLYVHADRTRVEAGHALLTDYCDKFTSPRRSRRHDPSHPNVFADKAFAVAECAAIYTLAGSNGEGPVTVSPMGMNDTTTYVRRGDPMPTDSATVRVFPEMFSSADTSEGKRA
jgi:hypothetical protein